MRVMVARMEPEENRRRWEPAAPDARLRPVEGEARVRNWMLASALGIVAALDLAAPATAQITCRANPLGGEVCVGLPAPSARARQPYIRQGRGLSGVQLPPRTETGGPSLTPAWRADALGNTFLRQSDLPPRRPPLPGVAPTRACRRDALGNLVCR